ncbi:cytochrome c biogenesis CcdA family protein [Timonella sp. A28]|uniref:cytochrome c biogenesis CcdA family protein n=1 Tax=Timonella sp. A28 TaxID=3442640 RepID=UPI003EBD651F
MEIGYAGAFLGGILTLLSPCSVMLLPAFFSYAFNSPGKLLARTGVFYLGLITTLVPLGVFSGALGSLVTVHRETLIAVVAWVVIAAGLVLLSGIPIPGLARKNTGSGGATSAVSVFLLGTVYAVAGVCAGPVLGAVFAISLLGGGPMYGAFILAIYALGMVVPLFILALLWPRLGARGRKAIAPKELVIGKWRNSWVMIVAGLLQIGIGFLLMATNGTANLGGLVDVRTQAKLETGALQAGSQVNDLFFIIGAIVVLAVIVFFTMRRNKRAAQSAGVNPNFGVKQ